MHDWWALSEELSESERHEYWEWKSKVKKTRRSEKTRAWKKEVVWLKALIYANYWCDLSETKLN